MGFFNSNDYKRGHKHGSQDAKNGKDKNYVRGGASVKYAIYGNKAFDTYRDGYDEGYRKVSNRKNR